MSQYLAYKQLLNEEEGVLESGSSERIQEEKKLECLTVNKIIWGIKLQNNGKREFKVFAVVKSQTRLSDFTFTFHFHALEKEMATHSSVLAWRIPGTAKPGGLPSMGSHRVGHDWSDLAAAAAASLLILILDSFPYTTQFFFLINLLMGHLH